MDELLAEVKAARRADAAQRKRTERIKALLIQVRLEAARNGDELKLADLEDRIGKFYDRATISRYTVPALRKAGVLPAADES